ncbi:MAG: hypothetical protein A4E37_00858 [Methanoregulaceae archaeon PtaB.Bin056]|nr:MAG: hypothetical protein A4E37_00858 [Methanoregulaceae archaeon PtaB.Bin056]
MNKISAWLSKNSPPFCPETSLALTATRHLSKAERAKLFSPDLEKMRTAEGRWYEAIIYEMFVEISRETDAISRLALKGADAPRGGRNARLGQNGIFYSRSGDITIRGNGQDLAEFDLLMVDGDNQVTFAEVLTSPSDLKEFEAEIEYKRTLLGYLFDQERVPFLMVASFNVANYSAGRRILRTPDTIHLQTATCEEIKSGLRGKQRPAQGWRPGLPHSKMVRASDLTLKRAFDYQKFHDWERNWVFSGVSNEVDVKSAANPHETSMLVKKILYGGLYPSALRTVCEEYEFSIRGKKIGFHEIKKQFSKVVLATDLPGYEPLMYFRSNQKREYLKMVQDREGNFKFERFTPSRVGFFLWLESLGPSLGSRITSKILDAFSPR